MRKPTRAAQIGDRLDAMDRRIIREGLDRQQWGGGVVQHVNETMRKVLTLLPTTNTFRGRLSWLLRGR
jgi:hypothetical protein